MRSVLYLLVAVTVVVSAACGPRGTGAETRRTATALTSEEIHGSTAPTVYELIQMLRPNWLRARGATSLRDTNTVVVYINRVRSGGPEVLRTIRPDAVESLRFVGETTATSVYGAGHGHGVIEVTLIAGH